MILLGDCFEKATKIFVLLHMTGHAAPEVIEISNKMMLPKRRGAQFIQLITVVAR